MKKERDDSRLLSLKITRIMKITAILILAGILQVSAVTYAQEHRISVAVENGTFYDVVSQIEKQSEFMFFYKSEEIDNNQRINLKVKDKLVSEILSEITKNNNLTYKITGKHIIITKATTTSQALRKITGIITDENGEPIIGANIVEKGTTNGTITDIDGRFSLDVADKSVLIVSYIGYDTQTISVTSKSSYNIKLAEDTKALEEVVVIGYGSARKKDVTGALTRVNVTEKETSPNVNAVQALRGSVAGLRVIDTGMAGADGNIQIRGTASITASNEPLIVLDGVPFSGGKLSDINTNDIESMDVLKDASSTAIYGSRGANGVIMITTKKGTTSKPRLNYNGYVGFSDFAHMPKMMGPDRYLQLRKDAEAYMDQPWPFPTLEEENIKAGRTIDTWDVIKQSAPMTEHELSVSGKGEQMTYYLSGAYTNQKSALAGDKFERLSVRANFDIDITKWLKIGTNSSFAMKDYSGNKADWGIAGWLSPFSSLRYDDGSLRKLPSGDGMITNPLWKVEMEDNKEVSYSLTNNNYMTVQLPIKGLSYQMNVANNLRFKELDNYIPSYDRDGFSWLGSGNKEHSFRHDLIFENILKYNNTFAEVHNVDVTLMYGYEQSKWSSSTLGSSNIFNDALGYNSLGIGENQTAKSGAGKSAAVSSMARVGYRFSDRYMINLTVRNDGFSAFGADKKYGTFPSVGLGWAVSQEKFMKNISWINYLKLRLSWGKNGNRGIDSYTSLSNMDLTQFVYGDGGSSSIGLYPTSMANPDLGWETSSSYNLGVDFSVFNSRISGALDVYTTKTTDLLLKVRIPNMSGYETFLSNIGETSNKGIEITINTENIKTKDFSWNSTLVFSSNFNKILHLTGEDLNGDGKEDDDLASKWFIGYSLGSNYDYVFDGIWQEGDDFSIDKSARPGDIKFKDLSGNGSIGPEDRMVLHNNRPKAMISLNNSFRYKDFSLSFLLDARLGGYAPNAWTNPGTNQYNRTNQLDLPYWTPENPRNDRPSVGYSNPRSYGFYEKLSYLRFQDISLSYDLPKNLIQKISLSNLKVYISGKNIATWTNWNGWDPEHATGGRSAKNGPLLRSWIFGLQISL
ncbi:TonB-dependent receptor [Parabacteroides johnsonii]|jgi:tonB-linked outer membrane protein, susC/ragA family|uniref:TonB-dependent receptor n=1 Tax=Parabacteroides johnsonii TaxID=387661 RepID=UPI00242E3A7D|nr:TonB-dependent receptor [Parabacteroides johnsonii]